MWNAHKVLVVAPAHASLLLPQWVFPDNDGSYPLLNQQVNHPLTGGVQVMIDPPVARRGDALHLLGHLLSVLFGQFLFEFLHVLIIPLVPRLERTTVNQPRDKTLADCSY